MIVSTDDDCSVNDTDIFNPSSTEYGDTALGLRCGLHQEALHAVARYVDGLDEAIDSSRLIFGVLGGVPVDLETSAIGTILADPRMTVEESASTPGRLATACTSDMGSATPARRLLSTAQGLESNGSSVVIGSVCQSSYQGFFDRLVDTIGGQLGVVCPE